MAWGAPQGGAATHTTLGRRPQPRLMAKNTTTAHGSSGGDSTSITPNPRVQDGASLATGELLVKIELHRKVEHGRKPCPAPRQRPGRTTATSSARRRRHRPWG